MRGVDNWVGNLVEKPLPGPGVRVVPSALPLARGDLGKEISAGGAANDRSR